MIPKQKESTYENYSHYQEEPSKEKKAKTKKHQAIQYIIVHKISSVFKSLFIFTGIIAIHEEFPSPSLEGFISISSIIFIIVYIFHNKAISEYF
jgi:hypothetical protein